MARKPKKIYRFRIALLGIEPQIWREIDVPENYSFWDLHVAIQNAMGWLDCHLHEFRLDKQASRGRWAIGIPDDDEIIEYDIAAGWEVPVKKYFTVLGHSMFYVYDFGDNWQHEVTLVGLLLPEHKQTYPRCYAGERACPPEDCGSIPGYYHLLEVLSSPDDEEYDDMATWLQGHAKNYWPYKPDKFSAKRVRFDDPDKRWRLAFEAPQQP